MAEAGMRTKISNPKEKRGLIVIENSARGREIGRGEEERGMQRAGA